jgi:hypothetical protein
VLELEFPLRTVAGLNAREHWRARATRVRNERIAVAWRMQHAPKPGLPVRVTLTRLSAGTLDSDNLQGAFKGVRDAIATSYSIPDNDPRIEWAYAQEKCKRGTYRVRITIHSTGAMT